MRENTSMADRREVPTGSRLGPSAPLIVEVPRGAAALAVLAFGLRGLPVDP